MTSNKTITTTVYWMCIVCHLRCVTSHLFLTITPREKKLKWELTCSVSYRKKTDAVVIRNQVCLILVCAWLIKLGKFNVSSLYQAKHFNLLLDYLICTLKFLLLGLILAMYLSKLCAPSCTFSGKRAMNGELKCKGRIFDEKDFVSSELWLALLETQPWERAAMGQDLGSIWGLPYLLVAWLIVSLVTLSMIIFFFSLTHYFYLFLLKIFFGLSYQKLLSGYISTWIIIYTSI